MQVAVCELGAIAVSNLITAAYFSEDYVAGYMLYNYNYSF